MAPFKRPIALSEAVARLRNALNRMNRENLFINLEAAPHMMKALLEVDIILKAGEPDLKRARQLVREALIVAVPPKRRKGRWQ